MAAEGLLKPSWSALGGLLEPKTNSQEGSMAVLRPVQGSVSAARGVYAGLRGAKMELRWNARQNAQARSEARPCHRTWAADRSRAFRRAWDLGSRALGEGAFSEDT